ncbi:MAG: hypothetical protein NC120_05140 [Ruminococcus sp.]|nr:hypothetical protein [Ruminococcus sp.]
MKSGYEADFIKEVKAGGFAVSDIIFIDRDPVEVERVNDNEVYAIYEDPESPNVKWKQTWKAEGSGNKRYNFMQTVERVSE